MLSFFSYIFFVLQTFRFYVRCTYDLYDSQKIKSERTKHLHNKKEKEHIQSVKSKLKRMIFIIEK